MSEPLFLAAPFFLLRTPYFPIEEYEKLSVCANIQEYLGDLFKKSAELREAILIASPQLYNALKTKERSEETALFALFKYVLRMATRATPFGFFAFVSIGSFSQENRAFFDLNQIQRRIRPDMEWLVNFTDQFNVKSIKKNPLIKKVNERIELSYLRKKQESSKASVSIQVTPLLQLILEKTQDFIEISDLIKILKIEMPLLDQEKATQVIKKLVQEEVLIPSTLPTLLSLSPFDDLIKKLGTTPEIEKVVDLLNQYAVKQDEFNLKTAIDYMQSLEKTSTPIQVDSSSKQDCSLSSSIQTEVGEAIEALWMLAPKQQGISHLRKYHEKFLDRWGTFRTLPILELTDEHKGIGFPDFSSTITASPSIEWQQFLQREWMLCVQGLQKEILLTEAVIERFGNKVKKELAPTSFDVYCEVIGDLILLQPTTAGGDGGATLGRFADLFDQQAKSSLKNFLDQEKELLPNTLFVESSYLPASTRSGNVAIHENFRDYSLELSLGDGIQLDDICVGATPDYLYLTLKNGQRINACAMNVLNPTLGPEIYRLIREISKDAFQLLHPFPWGDLEKTFFLPRVRYKKVILCPARWQISLDLLNCQSGDSLDKICKKLSDWCDLQKVPFAIFLTYADHKILLNRKHPFHLEEIARHLKNQSRLVLTEKIGYSEWVKSKSGSHQSEVVIPFLKNKNFCGNPLYPPSNELIPHRERWKHPGSEWVFAKLYLKKEEEVHLLRKFPLPFLHENLWFFIRYVDSYGPHIRLRIKAKNQLDNLCSWATDLTEQGVLKDFSLDSYEREIERYGGLRAIDLAEALFHADSCVALALLKLKTPLPNFILSTFSILDLLQGFELSTEEQIQLFEFMQLDRKRLEGFRAWKNTLLSYLSKKNHQELNELFLERRHAQENYLKCLRDNSIKSLFSIIGSVLHMNCNRILGVDTALEQQTYVYASHALSIHMQKEKNLVT